MQIIGDVPQLTAAVITAKALCFVEHSLTMRVTNWGVYAVLG